MYAYHRDDAGPRQKSANYYHWRVNEHTLFVLPTVGTNITRVNRQVPGLKPAGTSFSRNPVFLNQTTGARSGIPAQKRRRNDETDEHLSLRTNGVCTRLTSGGAAEWCALDGLGSNLESNLIAIASASEEMSREIRELGIEP